MSIRIQGFEDVFKDLDDMNISDAKKKRALNSGAEIVLEAVKKASPVRTGRMRDRWKARIRRIDGDLGFEVKGDTLEDIYNEFGSTSNKQHIGFFSKAVDKVADRVVNTVISEVLD